MIKNILPFPTPSSLSTDREIRKKAELILAHLEPIEPNFIGIYLLHNAELTNTEAVELWLHARLAADSGAIYEPIDRLCEGLRITLRQLIPGTRQSDHY